MPDIPVRHGSTKTLKRLKDRATLNEALSAAAAIRTRLAGRKFSDSVKLIRQDRRR